MSHPNIRAAPLARERKNRYTGNMRFFHRLTARLLFYAGLFLMVVGAVFLLGDHIGGSRIPLLWSCLFFIIGGLFVIIAIEISKRPIYLFFAVFFLLVGLFLFLSGLMVIPVGFTQGWPLLSIFAGIALVPAGLRHFRAISIPYLIPSMAFIVLGFVLIPFSFKLLAFSFKRFMIDWWPLLTVMTGFILVLFSLGTKHKSKD